MRLSAFITSYIQHIIYDWETFTRPYTPAAELGSPYVLHEHIKRILLFIAEDMESAQTSLEQIKKSHGGKIKPAIPSPAEVHASFRHASGFSLAQLVSEYRALRASVVKLWYLHIHDITHQDLLDLTRFHEAVDQALTESINDYTKRLEYSRNLFLGILSHDLRSPIATARMSAEVALSVKDENLNATQRMLLSQVMDCTDRAAEMINYLLDLTRVRLGSGIPIISTPMNMGEISKSLVDEMRMKHPEHIFNLKISPNTDGEWDRSRISQIFSNLLNNAVQYSFAGSSINITVEGTSNEMQIAVQNKGTPITVKSLNKIFESLIRGEDENQYNPPGSVNLGLGLYITKEIVNAHKGEISVISSEIEGTIFTVSLPRYSQQPVEA